MRIVCSPSGIIHPKLPKQGVLDLTNAGFEHIALELDWCCSGYELENFGKDPEPNPWEDDQDDSREHSETQTDHPNEEEWISVLDDPSEMERRFEQMIRVCHSKGLDVPVARAPYLLRETEREDLYETLLWLHKECIRYCKKVGCGFLIIPPPFFGNRCENEWEENRKYYLNLASAAYENQITILLPNQCRNQNGHLIRGVFSDAAIAANQIDQLNREACMETFHGFHEGKEGRQSNAFASDPIFGFCMDVGICSLCGQDMYQFAFALGNRVKAVILRDCDGQQESSLLPFSCVYQGQPKTDWLGLIRGLRQIGFDGDLLLDIRDTAFSFSPLLRPGLLALAQSTAQYMKWQIEIENLLKKYGSIVLFGAGNMCRNYMKCYGEQYPPLFTCDNNQARWGSRFCGLEIKPPEALKQLPDNCGIFICNIYYREIQQQLLDMGIQNIEFFNDEYMPSFHFDRLKGV